MNTLERLRLEEWHTISRWFKPAMRVLEVGGGNGYQASLIAAHGCSVVSVDVDAERRPGKSYFPVTGYDGRHLPFGNAEFDLVFSSNVLEHIRDLPGLLHEITRVTRPGGIMIHVLPTSAWRFWTSLAHYPFLVLLALGREMDQDEPGKSAGDVVARRGWWSACSRVIMSPSHGEHSSAAAELWYFSRRRWLKVFSENGFEVIEDYPNRIFYTGYALFPSLPMRARRLLSRVLGSSCRIFVMRRAVPSGNH